MVNLLIGMFLQRHKFNYLLVILVKPSVDCLKGKAEARGKFNETTCHRLRDIRNDEFGIQDPRPQELWKRGRSRGNPQVLLNDFPNALELRYRPITLDGDGSLTSTLRPDVWRVRP